VLHEGLLEILYKKPGALKFRYCFYFIFLFSAEDLLNCLLLFLSGIFRLSVKV
jgi:hypothetical protein